MSSPITIQQRPVTFRARMLAAQEAAAAPAAEPEPVLVPVVPPEVVARIDALEAAHAALLARLERIEAAALAPAVDDTSTDSMSAPVPAPEES